MGDAGKDALWVGFDRAKTARLSWGDVILVFESPGDGAGQRSNGKYELNHQ